MEFLETAWKNFRNLKPRRQQWCPGLNVISGPNGLGKTNLLESLNVLTGWGPFAAAGNKTASLPAWGTEREGAFLSGRAAGERELEVRAQIRTRVSLRADGEAVTHSELRSLVPSLSFLAQDVNLLDGPPSARRLFLDRLCALCSPLYARRLAEYKQLVRQRTAILRRPLAREHATALRATAFPVAQFGGWIRDSRRRAAALLAGALSGDAASAPFTVCPSCPSSGLLSELLPFETKLALELRGSMGLEDSAQDMAAALEASLERERYAGSVLVGPHRDDLAFSCLGRPAASVLSRGQKRRMAVSLILAAGRLIENRLRLKPVLLLDDVAAELDGAAKELTGRALQETGWQIFITGVENPFSAFPGICVREWENVL